ncbi:MAG TPA: cupin domain-containing protein [Candidatus Borkfalkia faecipullorum]|uniref:Cupin domain-containing protein n=1 Tax=Candidatus Borkfalkia faecipullorum TaxID=2838510 RepID=A0A9D1V6X0_9FIRM|nr:cupin domain-containing protein [Candidatus Borkfalkia faecipullorum]
MQEKEFERQNVFKKGAENTAYAQFFIGTSYLNPLTSPQNKPFFANVTFEPACRNNWHIHRAEKGGGQILLCVAGEGWYQEYGKSARSLKAGDVVEIPANVKHWHGAKKDSWFSHIAVELPGENTSNEWLEPVSEEEYEKLS